jgi:hypothetical protein
MSKALALREILRSLRTIKHEVTNQAGVVPRWNLFAPAAFFMDGKSAEASKLANIKGQLIAVQDAMEINKCTGN